LHHVRLAETLQQGGPAAQTLNNLQASGLTREQALGMINNLTTQQAFMISTQEIFYGSAVLFLALIGLVWFAKRPHRRDAGADAAGAH
jgi:DHA2 family multidrug resistance protein